jgi:hypothetical protein
VNRFRFHWRRVVLRIYKLLRLVTIHFQKERFFITISVIDWLDESGIGQIVVLGRAGCVKNVYTGHPYVNNEDDPFTPSSIIATPSNKIIVTDFRNDTLHVLSSVGFLLFKPFFLLVPKNFYFFGFSNLLTM